MTTSDAILTVRSSDGAAARGAGGRHANARAQTTGQDQNYTIDVSPKSMAALRFDMLNGEDGASYLNVDLFYGIPISGERPPWILDFGMNFGVLTGPDDQSDDG